MESIGGGFLFSRFLAQVCGLSLVFSSVCMAGVVPSIWDPNYASGTLLVFQADDAVAAFTLTSNFTFGGITYSEGSVSTNGFLTLGTIDLLNGAGCCSGDVSGLLSGNPRVSPGWTDLYTSVYMNAILNGVSFTWEGVDQFSFAPVLFQALLYNSGQILFGYESLSTDSISNPTLIGLSVGGNAADPGESNLAPNSTFAFGASPTIYQVLAPTGGGGGLLGPTIPVTFDGSNIQFDPSATTPEPSTLLLGLSGLAALFTRRRALQNRLWQIKELKEEPAHPEDLR